MHFVEDIGTVINAVQNVDIFRCLQFSKYYTWTKKYMFWVEDNYFNFTSKKWNFYLLYKTAKVQGIF